jgi:hypothetical protein
MPVAPAANAYILGIHKQTDEATVGSVADYTLPVYSATGGPQAEMRRIEVTDSTSIEGDPYKGPTSWQKTLEVPALGASTGRFLQAMWPTDTKTSSGPSIHTFSGLGGTQSWYSLYETFTAGTLTNTFGKGLCTSLGYTATQDGGPLRLQAGFVGEVPSITAYTVTTADVLANGYFTLQQASTSILIDLDTANAAPTLETEAMESITITVDRNVTPQPIADSVAVANLGQGKLTTGVQMTWLYQSWDAYHASYFGSVAGTAASSTIVKGALQLLFQHTVQATWNLTIYIPSIVFIVDPPVPDAGGAPLKLTVNGFATKPTSGDHIQPTLLNGVTTAY